MKNTRMIRAIVSVAMFAFTLCIPAFAQKAAIQYVEGVAKVKSAAGSQRAADIGGTVVYGESVITGKNGLVELTLPNGSLIRVTENSVFGYSSVGTGEESRSVLATTAGKVSYKLNKAVGKSPVIQSNSMVAGVRGTEFTVYSARDGSTLIEVTGGIVDVESQGTSVELFKDEAVEVAPGEVPGQKYTFLGKELDFSSWNKGKSDEFLADPVAAIKKIETQLASYEAGINEYKQPLADATKVWSAAMERNKELNAKGDKAEIDDFQKSTLDPAQRERAKLILNIRYYALNYLSVRRYVASNMYMEMKSRYPLARTAEAETFFALHKELIDRYEDRVVVELNENDY
jgi:hypothetical protein